MIYFPLLSSGEYLATMNEATHETAKRAMGERWAKNWDANSTPWRSGQPARQVIQAAF